jgi:BCD family chlorophyll transporter-like MFS transporter
MMGIRKIALGAITRIGPRYLPFAEVASEDVPLSRLLRLSLFQVTVGMALVLLVGTLNRVMIVELQVPASLVGVMIALPIVFAPFRTLIGFRSDIHASALGWRRVPFIWKGTMLQFGGFAVMPFALLVLSGYGEAHDAPLWIGHGSAALAFLLVGAGVHTVQTVGLALATDLVPVEDQPKVVGLMYVMLLLGMIVSALVFGALLQNYSPGRLIQVIQGAAVVTILLNGIALWKQEARDRGRAQALAAAPPPAFGESWRRLIGGEGALRLLVVIGLGTFGYGMADVLLEPYGGQILGMSVAETTKLTAAFAAGGLGGFALASRVLGRGGSPIRTAAVGALIGVPGFGAIMFASSMQGPALFVVATLAIGFGAGLFGHGTLTATMRAAPPEQVGLALGAWGAVQATAAGLGIAVGGVVRDLIVALSAAGRLDPALSYLSVFGIEILFLALALVAAGPLLRGGTGSLQSGPYAASGMAR